MPVAHFSCDIASMRGTLRMLRNLARLLRRALVSSAGSNEPCELFFGRLFAPVMSGFGASRHEIVRLASLAFG
jgi:hypothetical protein